MSDRKGISSERREPNLRAEVDRAAAISVKTVRRNVRANAQRTTKKGSQINRRHEAILRKAQVYLLFEAKRPMLWTVAGVREERCGDGSRRWIVAVHLRFPTGFEGYLGDLLYDGERITELTDIELMRERAEQIAADPEGIRRWNEYRASTLRAGQA